MQTFDQSLLDLYARGWISYEWAMHYASNPSEFALRVSGVQPGEQELDWTGARGAA
jgi:twitching motility protein PilT